jgi:hypothetical protein
MPPPRRRPPPSSRQSPIEINSSPWYGGFETVVDRYEKQTGNKVTLDVECAAVGARIALLGIELPTRRRNRMNGVVVDLDVSGFVVRVEQSFGNCPQYIQRRDYGGLRPPRFPTAEPLDPKDEWALDLLRRADSAFVVSSTPPAERNEAPASTSLTGAACRVSSTSPRTARRIKQLSAGRTSAVR